MIHPIKKYKIDDLLYELELRKEKGYVREKTKGPLSLFSYTEACASDKMWDGVTSMARGLIIDTDKCEVVGLCFNKFFNYGERSFELPDEPFESFEKVDGSLAITFFYDNEWHVATRGSFESEQANWATKWLRDNGRCDNLDVNHTYLFEIIYRENKIVINYPFEGLVLLGAYNNITGAELPYDAGIDYRDANGIPVGYDVTVDLQGVLKSHKDFRLIARYTYASVDEMVECAKGMSYEEEGFVVRFESGYRIKIKSEEYVRIHHIISNITPLGVWRLLINKQGWSDFEFQKELPEEILSDYLQIKKILSDGCNDIYNRAYNVWRNVHRSLGTNNLSVRDSQAMFVKTMNARYFGEPYQWHRHGILPSVVLSIRKNEPEQAVRARIYRSLRPNDNYLQGYEPSNSMNRFTMV